MNTRPVNSLYRGMPKFKKHYYPDVGDLKPDGEEHECAQIIDSLDRVNSGCAISTASRPVLSGCKHRRALLSRLCLQANRGRILVVEYKALPSTDAEEKRLIGDVGKTQPGPLFVCHANQPGFCWASGEGEEEPTSP
jgi:type III restriction enzyme